VEDNLTTQLSENEKAELKTLEGIIQQEMGSFMAVGNALLTIRDNKLYREQYQSFNEYSKAKWGIDRSYAGRLIRGSQVAANLGGQMIQESKDGAHGHQLYTPCEIQPIHERQIRPLTVLEPDQQCEVWEEAVRSADGKVVTFKQVKALVEARVGPPPPKPVKPRDPYAYSDANAFVTMAIINLERIRDDDPLRVDALGRISKWIQEKLTIWTKGE
jgi:hypothetical protein